MHLSRLSKVELLKNWHRIMIGSFSPEIFFFIIHLAYSTVSSKFSISFWNITHSKAYLPCNLVCALKLRSQKEYFI